MAKQTINIGATANDGTGSTLRAGMDICNDNFTELYALTGSGTVKGSQVFYNSMFSATPTTDEIETALGITNSEDLKGCIFQVEDINTVYLILSNGISWYSVKLTEAV